MGIKGFILDLDNTLYDENQYLYNVFLDFWTKYFFTQENFEDICTQTLSDETRLHSKDIFRTFLELTPLGYAQNYHDELFSIYASIQCKLSLYEDAQEFLDFLKQQDYQIAILTNGPIQAQKNKINNLKITGIPIFYAREDGIEYEKPHPKAFLKVLNHFRLSPKDCCMIGDNPYTDIEGADKARILPILLKRGYAKNVQNHIQCDTISNFKVLKDLIK
ncbi:HAD family hydrolase [Helicobacter anseris]|nr:HAD family hydrolase [Helicobacter anseris]